MKTTTPTEQKLTCEELEALLADTENKVAKAYKVWKKKSMYGREYMGIERSAFLIGADGVILEAWYKISPKDTPANLLKALGK